MNLETIKTNKNFIFYLIFAGFFHFLVDFLPISTIYFFYIESSKNLLIIVYDILAFGLQPLFGFLLDRHEYCKKLFSIFSIFLVLSGAILNKTFVLSIALLGVGNALFHTSFAKDILKTSRSNFPLGFFISFGVLGLGIGFSFFSEILIKIFILIGALMLLLYVFFESKKCFIFEKRNYEGFKSSNIIVFLLILVIISVFFRGALGPLTPSTSFRYSFLIISFISFLGKIIGGLVKNKLNIVCSLVISVISFIFLKNEIFILLFVFSINILMPTTLDYLRKLLPKHESLALGISAFMLLVPIFLLNSIEILDKKLFLIIFFVLHLIVLIFIFCIDTILSKRKEA